MQNNAENAKARWARALQIQQRDVSFFSFYALSLHNTIHERKNNETQHCCKKYPSERPKKFWDTSLSSKMALLWFNGNGRHALVRDFVRNQTVNTGDKRRIRVVLAAVLS